MGDQSKLPTQVSLRGFVSWKEVLPRVASLCYVPPPPHPPLGNSRREKMQLPRSEGLRAPPRGGGRHPPPSNFHTVEIFTWDGQLPSLFDNIEPKMGRKGDK